MNMIISGVSADKDGHNKAYIMFEDEDKMLEAVIPECKIIKNSGFTDEECSQLIDYMKANLTDLKRLAARINPVTAMMKEP